MYYLEPFSIQVTVFGVCFELFQQPEEAPGGFLWESSGEPWFGELSPVWDFFLVVSVCYGLFLLDYSF